MEEKKKITMNKRGKIKKFDDLVQHFIKMCEVKNLSKGTLDYYWLSAHTFNKFCGNPELEEIDDDLITDFILELKVRMKPVSINSRLRGVRAVFNYGNKIGAMKRIEVPMVKYTKEAKEGYTEAELILLLKKPDIDICSFSEYRNWVTVNYLLGTGCRLSTLINIQIRDIDFDNKMVVNRHMKTKQQIIVPLPTSLIIILREYLEIRGGSGMDYLFPLESDEQLTDRGLKTAIRTYNHSRGVLRTSIHAFRHTWAKSCILNGMDIFTLQKLGGWRDLEMVRNYVNLYSTDIKNYDDMNPLENILSRSKKKIKM